MFVRSAVAPVRLFVRSVVGVVGVGWPIARRPSLQIEHLKERHNFNDNTHFIVFNVLLVCLCTRAPNTNESPSVAPRADRIVTQSHRIVPCNPFDYDKSQEDNQEISNARESQESPDITSWQ